MSQNEGGNWLSKGEDFLKKQKVGRIVKEELRRVGWQRMELKHRRKAESVKWRTTIKIFQ